MQRQHFACYKELSKACPAEGTIKPHRADLDLAMRHTIPTN
jgi:hypothetical protein